MSSILDLSEERQQEIINQLWNLAPRDEEEEGIFFEGDVDDVGHCQAYKSPDGKVLRFTVEGEGPFQVLSMGAALGFSLGDAAPDWALVGDDC